MIKRILTLILVLALSLPALTVEAITLTCRDSGSMALAQCCCTAPAPSCDASHMAPGCCCDVRVSYRLDERPPVVLATKLVIPAFPSAYDAYFPAIAHPLHAAVLSTPISTSLSFLSAHPNPPVDNAVLCVYRI